VFCPPRPHALCRMRSLLVPVVLSLLPHVQAESSDSEGEAVIALGELYASTSGGKWKHNDRWMSSSSVCSWQFVKCQHGTITELKLADNGLVGTLSMVGGLDDLSSISVANNPGLSGTMPHKLARLERLDHVDISGASISGTLPAWLGHLKKLDALRIARTPISGTISPHIAALRHLHELTIDHTLLSGTIPTTLDLDFGRKVGMDASGHGKPFREHGKMAVPWQVLDYVSLSDTAISGTIPPGEVWSAQKHGLKPQATPEKEDL